MNARRRRLRVDLVHLVLALAVLLLLAGPPASSDAQPKPRRPFRVGVLHPAFFPSVPPLEGLKQGLKSLGLEEGRDVTYEVRFTRGRAEAVAPEAAALVASGVDVIFAFSEDMAVAVKRATSTIPIVFSEVGDPVAAGLVTAIGRPGGNVTGVSALVTELVPKRLEIFKTLVPTLRRVWAIYHVDDRSSQAAARKALEVTTQLGLELVDRAVRTSEELVAQLKTLRPGDGLLAPPLQTLNIPGLILDLQFANRVPAVFVNTFWVQAGGLVAYGADPTAGGTQAARLVERILKGARPQDLPVETITKLELAVNVKAARSLGLTIPTEILLRAEQIIQ